jgi:hypothetical protein
MTFGQQSGPPASARQVAQLLDLLQAAGHRGFRDARGPMRFTQRQGGGKFTIDEAAAFIRQLEEPEPEPEPDARPAPELATAQPKAPASGLRRFPAEELAAELRRRGWTLTEPG